MGFKKGNQNIDSVFYGTDYVERMYLGGEQFFQASYLDFYKTNFFSIGLGQKNQIDNPKGDGAISYIKTEWSSQYGYQLEVNQASTGRSTNYTDAVFKENFSFMLPEGKYLLKVTIKNIPYSKSEGVLYCDLLKKEDNTSLLKNPVFYNGTAGGFSVDEDTEVYLGMFINDLNVKKTSIFSLELSPAEVVSGKFVEKPSLMVRGKKKEIYNSSVSSINITIPETAFYSGKEYPIRYIDSDAFNYEVTENGTTVSQPLTKISTITVEGDNMIGFGNRAFKNCSSCTSFSCSSRYSIGSQAFENCTGLTSINLPITVTSIGSKAFSGCSNLETINIPFIGESATGTHKFSYIFGTVPTSLTTVGFSEGNNITKIPDFAFYDCSSLKSITIPNSVTSIGLYAFYNCSGLKSITIPNSVTSISSYAFGYCSGLTGITIPNSVTSIGLYAFYYCRSLRSIFVERGNTKYHSSKDCLIETATKTLVVGCNDSVIPTDGSVTSIGRCAFAGYNNLITIIIPNGVTSIGDRAFSDCSGLTNIFVESGNTKYHSSENCLIETETKTLVVGCKNSVIPTDGSVTNIGDYAFDGCSGLTSITIPDSVTRIGDYAFYGCSGLTSITMSNNVISIGDSAFSGCSGLTSITIPNGVIRIGESAFYGCSSLTSITIPKSVVFIDPYAFSGCSGLASITVESGNTKYHSSENCLIETETKTLVVGCKNSVIPTDGSVTNIGDYAFDGCSGLTSITIPNRVRSIGTSAFSGCSGLTSITIPDSVISIGNSAFYGCDNLQYEEYGNAKYLGNHLIKAVSTDITEVTIKSSTKTIAGGAFSGCRGLTSITIPDSVISIGNSAFSGCSGLTSITIPNGVTSIGAWVFNGCSSLKSITIPNGVKSIGSHAFEGCSSLTSINIPNNVKSIGNSAFSGCSSLKRITIPNSVTSIDGYAFKDCNSLTIYAEAMTKPSGWNKNWNPSNRPVVWGV